MFKSFIILAFIAAFAILTTALPIAKPRDLIPESLSTFRARHNNPNNNPSSDPNDDPNDDPDTQDDGSGSGAGVGVSVNTGTTFSGGQATFFSPNTGACGWDNSASDFIVAMDISMYGDQNSVSQYCGKQIQITNTQNGNVATAYVADCCPDCENDTSLDMTTGLFDFLSNGDEDEGVFGIAWAFTDGPTGTGQGYNGSGSTGSGSSSGSSGSSSGYSSGSGDDNNDDGNDDNNDD